MTTKEQYQQTMSDLKSLAEPKNLEKMAKFGICTKRAIGVSMPNLRKVGKKIGKNHELAILLWDSKIHEAMTLASIIEDETKVTSAQMDSWIKEFNSWDLCDQVCLNLFYRVPIAYEKIKKWRSRKKEFEKRAAFALIAVLAVKDKKAKDKDFEELFSFIEQAATDERIYVKKAVNWALRQIGKRNLNLNKKAIAVAKKIKKIDSKCAKWIANDAIRELESEAVLRRLSKK